MISKWNMNRVVAIAITTAILLLSLWWLWASIDAGWQEPAIAILTFAAALIAKIVLWRPPDHPPNTESGRGPLTPCTFRIHALWKSENAFDALGDVRVEMQNPTRSGKIFLIPSGLARQELRDTAVLRSQNKWLSMKKQATQNYIERYDGKDIKGLWFSMDTSYGQAVKVYARSYDSYLNKHFKENSPKTPR